MVIAPSLATNVSFADSELKGPIALTLIWGNELIAYLFHVANPNAAISLIQQHSTSNDGYGVQSEQLRPASIESDLSQPSVEFVKSQMMALGDSTEKWGRYLFDPNASVDVNAITETVGFVFQTMRKFGVGAINLYDVRAPLVNGEHLAAVLRATYSVKKFTPGWDTALETAKTALHNQGVSAKDALFGIIG